MFYSHCSVLMFLFATVVLVSIIFGCKWDFVSFSLLCKLSKLFKKFCLLVFCYKATKCIALTYYEVITLIK